MDVKSETPPIKLGANSGAPELFSNGYRGYVLFMLMFVSVFNFLDRQILAILIEPIKLEFALSDSTARFPCWLCICGVLHGVRNPAGKTRRCR